MAAVAVQGDLPKPVTPAPAIERVSSAGAEPRRSPKTLRLARAKHLNLFVVQLRGRTDPQQLWMELLQGLGSCIEGISSIAIPLALLPLPAVTAIGLSTTPSFHGLLVEILFGLLVVNGEAALLLRIKRLGRGTGEISGRADRDQLLLSRIKSLQRCWQPWLNPQTEVKQLLLFSHPLTLLQGGSVGPATSQAHRSHQGQQPESADHTNPWAPTTLTGEARFWSVAPKWG